MAHQTATSGNPETKRHARVQALGPAIVPIAVVVAGLAGANSSAVRSIVPMCPTKFLTGWPCPLCGTFRVAMHLASGNVTDAFLLAPIPLFLLVGLTSIAVTTLVRGAPMSTLPFWRKALVNRSVGLILVVLYIVTLARHVETGLP